MINQIEIQNFKSHKKTILELSPRVNVIVGPTDSGKSAIIQALRWLITNRPSGDSFRSSWGGMGTICGVVLDEGQNITRIKSSAENMYRLDSVDFRAIKTDIPEEIVQVLNLNEVNLQTQFESHFLLSKSAGEVAAHFNKVAHLDKIDEGMKTIQSWLSTEKKSLEAAERELSEFEEELKQFDILPEIEEKVEDLESLDKKQKKISNQILQGERLLDDIFDTGTEIRKVEKLLEVKPLLDNILVIDADINRAGKNLNQLTTLCGDIKDIEKWEQELKEVITDEDLVCNLIEINDSIKELGKERNDLNACIQAIDGIGRDELKLKKQLEDREKEFHKHLGKGKICPLCDSIIK